MDKVFAIGDIHGSYKLLEKLLPFWNREEEQLVFLGDYIDRGSENLEVIQKVMELSKEYGAITLSGNHEQIFLNWLKNPEKISEFYFNPKVGGATTVQSLLSTPSFETVLSNFSVSEMAEQIQKQHRGVIDFMKRLNRFYHWNHYLFVHAGIDANVENFKDSKIDDFLWIRDEFTSIPHKSKEVVVFGHTPTIFLNDNQTSNVWISPCRKKVGIDGGGAIYEGGRIHGVVFSKASNQIVIYTTGVNEEVTSSTIQL